ncbi:MAG: PQQ-binding-like beta-propeller repeat protein [Thermomicrobiales bacterium]
MTATLPPMEHVADLLPAFVNRTLTQPERAQVMGHLTRCPACAAELRAWQAIQQATRDLPFTRPGAPLPDTVLDQIWARIDHATPPPLHASTTPPPNRRPSEEDPMTAMTMPLVPAAPLAPEMPAPRLRLSRRALLALAGAATVLLPLSGAPQRLAERLPGLNGVLPWQDALPPDFPTFRGDWQHTGVSAGAGPAKKPEILWQMASAGEMRVQPVMVDGVVYASSRDGKVYAVDYATGAQRWATEIGGAPEAQMTVAAGLVFAGDNNPYSSYGNLAILNATDGAEVWRLADAQTSAPLVIDGTLYTGTGDGLLHAYDAATGDERWQTSSALMSRGFSYADGVLYYGGQDNAVYALRADDGTQLWRFQAENGQLGTTVVGDGLIYEIAFDGTADQVYALDAVTGEERWRFAINARVQPPALRDGVLYLPGGDGSIYALDAAKGTVRWRFDFGNPTVYGGTLAGDLLYVTGGGPTLYAVNIADGTERWHLDLDGVLGAPPMVTGGSIYVTTTTGNLYALGERASDAPTVLPAPQANADTGAAAQFLWSVRNGTEPISDPHGMAIAPNGDIWLAEGGKNRFLIFTPDGTLREAWGTAGPGDGEFNFTWKNGGGGYGGIAFGQDGSIFVADPGNARVQKFDRNRQFVTAWSGSGAADGAFEAPVHVATDAAGNVYVSDGGGIQKFSSDGAFLARVGGPGEGNDQYTCSAVLSADSAGNVLVPDCQHQRVLQFGPDGGLLMTLGADSTGPGALTFPTSTATDAAGNIYVTDQKQSRVSVYDANGAFLTSWGAFGSNDGQFIEPASLVLDGAGHVYVADFRLGNLQKFQLLPPLWPLAGTPVP